MEELQLPSLRVNIKQNNFTTILKSVRNPDSDKTKQGGSQAESEQGLVVTPQGNALTITL